MIETANGTHATRETVEAYYDERVQGKLRDFTGLNPRIEAAIQTIAEWAPPVPRRVLEIGCGIGATSWRMARAWPGAEVVGVDISPLSIEVASICFRRPNLTFRIGPLAQSAGEGKFDLIVMMDVYEHITPSDRPELHRELQRLLSVDSRLVITAPTPAHQNSISPSTLQPVDEDITISELGILAADVGAQLLSYREVGIWRYGDYFHCVFGRFETLAPVQIRQPIRGGKRAKFKRLLGHTSFSVGAHKNYLGWDILTPASGKLSRPFKVSSAERCLLAEAWFRRVGR